jgi:hypothetical protein
MCAMDPSRYSLHKMDQQFVSNKQISLVFGFVSDADMKTKWSVFLSAHIFNLQQWLSTAMDPFWCAFPALC